MAAVGLKVPILVLSSFLAIPNNCVHGFVLPTLRRGLLATPFGARNDRKYYDTSSVTSWQKKRRLLLHQHCMSDEDFSESSSNSLDLTSSDNFDNHVEFWLDLRDTALFPKAAIEYLSENVDGDLLHMVDRVILSEEAANQLLLQQEKRKKQEQIAGDLEFVDTNKAFSILYVPSRSDDLVLSDSSTEQSFPCGKILRSEQKALQNPIVALDIVMTQGGWVLLEPDPETEDSVWMEEASSFMTFLLSSTTSTSSLNLGGILLDSGEDNNDNNSDQSLATLIGKGLAIFCSSRTALMEVSKAVLSFTGLPGESTTSPGGILLPSSPPAENELMLVDSDEASSGNKKSKKKEQLPVAMVIPLDIKLWQTTIDLMSDDD